MLNMNTELNTTYLLEKISTTSKKIQAILLSETLNYLLCSEV